jgi:hypothetical protein
MAKAPAKTTENNNSVSGFIKTVDDKRKQADSFELISLFEEATGFPAKMWGPAIIGFGSYHYRYATGHEGDAPMAGFSPRKNAITIYLATDFAKRDELLQKLGKHKISKACIYFNKLEDIQVPVLKKMISESVKHMKRKYK